MSASSALSEINEIIETAAAFANTEGGTIALDFVTIIVILRLEAEESHPERDSSLRSE